jgi:hypothetical protein
MDAAFDRPRRYTRNHNLRLSDVAGQVVETEIADAVVATQRNGADDDLAAREELEPAHGCPDDSRDPSLIRQAGP